MVDTAVMEVTAATVDTAIMVATAITAIMVDMVATAAMVDTWGGAKDRNQDRILILLVLPLLVLSPFLLAPPLKVLLPLITSNSKHKTNHYILTY